MGIKSVNAKHLDVLDDGFFNQERFMEWYNTLLEFAVETTNQIREEIGNLKGVEFEVNTVLLEEAVYDAIIGLKTIVVSKNSDIKEPNSFKIAAYLGYWFLRHKPIIFRAEKHLDLDNLVFPSSLSEEDKWIFISDMKHINEVAITNYLLRSIFEVNCKKPVCGKFRCHLLRKKGNFSFENFQVMLETLYNKLRYYLTYRAISPKTIEHFLEAYTLHPYLPYTCEFWNLKE